jgi:predicted ribosomally synthesized peptide with nif11-like leader
MSIQSARDFLTKVTKDEEFRKGLTGCKSGADRHEFAKGAGFEFTVDEIKAASSELQDADLETVFGGVTACGTSDTQHCGVDGAQGY